MGDIVDYFVGVIRRVARLERRIDNSVRFGSVHPGSVDAKNKTVRLRIGGTDEKPRLSPPIPYSQWAGKLKLHVVPSDGQQMAMISQAGDVRQALAVPFGWSNANSSPSDKDDEGVLTFGDARIELRGNEIVVKVPKIKFECGGSTFELSGAGLKMLASNYDFD